MLYELDTSDATPSFSIVSYSNSRFSRQYVLKVLPLCATIIFVALGSVRMYWKLFIMPKCAYRPWSSIIRSCRSFCFVPWIEYIRLSDTISVLPVFSPKSFLLISFLRFSPVKPYSIACALSVFVLHWSLYAAKWLSLLL